MSEGRVAGTWGTFQSGDVYVDGAWHRILRAEAYVVGAWKDAGRFLDALSASVDLGSVSAPTSTETVAVTVTPAGGLAPYTYAWTGGSPATASSPTAATTTFFSTSDAFVTFTCTVTDSLGSTATVTVDAEFYTIPFGGF